MSAVFRLTNRALLMQRSLAINQALQHARSIKTSQKKDETATAIPTAPAPVTAEDFKTASPKNWVSWGFDYKSEKEDRNITKSSFFVTVTLCLVWGGLFWIYMPDVGLRDWAQREAFLELRRREKAGLDLISPHYADPANMELPSDDDLGDTEIII